MGFWMGLVIGYFIGAFSVGFALYLVRRARDITFNHNHYE